VELRAIVSVSGRNGRGATARAGVGCAMRKARPRTSLVSPFTAAALALALLAACSGSGGSDISAPTAQPSADAGRGGSVDASGPSASPDGATPINAADAALAADAPAPVPHDAGGGIVDAGGNGATPTLPAATGACPTFANGTVTFAPAGIPARSAQVWMSSAAATKHGPLLIYWYATGSSTLEASYSLGATLATIEAAGGIVVAPQADPTAGQFEWFIVNGSSKLDDFLVADEIVACAAKSTNVDTSHIHVMGMSAGALQTTAMSFMRSSYVASVATYSGGMPPGFSPAVENASNKFAALIFDGGSTDDVFNVDFQAASQAYYTNLKAAGHFAAICDHGMGHAIPLDAAPSVAIFFQANAFGVSPSPYANGLPSGFPSYCTL
jgi:predicted esterase